MACLLYNTGKCLQLLLFNRPNFGVHFILHPILTAFNILYIKIRGHSLYIVIQRFSFSQNAGIRTRMGLSAFGSWTA